MRRSTTQLACVFVSIADFLLDRLHAAGLSDVTAVEPVEGGMAALAGLATRRSGPPLFVKSFIEVPSDDVFAAEAEGLDVLREQGAVATPEVVLVTRDVLVLSVLRPQPTEEGFWEQFAHALAQLHTSTVHDTSAGRATTGSAAAGRRTRGRPTGTSSSPGAACCAGCRNAASGRRLTSGTGKRLNGSASGCPTCSRPGRPA